MSVYLNFILEAKLNAAKGFGHPSTEHNYITQRQKPKLTKEEIARWRARSSKDQKNYLKKYPNSKYKGLPARGSIITRSKLISAKPWAKAMVQKGTEALKNLGYKGSTITRDTSIKMANSLHAFLKNKDPKPYIEKASNNFKNFYSKLKPDVKKEVDSESESISKSSSPPSKTILGKRGKGIIFALVGMAAIGALYASGLTPPVDVCMFLGVKILDTAFEGAKKAVDEPIAAFVAAHGIRSFFRSKDSEDYAKDQLNALSSQGIKPDYEEEPEVNDKKIQEEPVSEKEEVKKEEPVYNNKEFEKGLKAVYGDKVDPNDFEETSPGVYKRKPKVVSKTND